MFLLGNYQFETQAYYPWVPYFPPYGPSYYAVCSNPLPDPAKNNGCDGSTATAGTNPCNAGTGNKYQHETDYAGTGAYPLHMEREYNSGGMPPPSVATPPSVVPTVWGSQWRGFYDRFVWSYGNTRLAGVEVQRANGKQYSFSLIGASTAGTGDADVVGTLTRLGMDTSGNATGWTYTNERDEVETYDATGKLVTLTDRAGLTQTLTYSCTPVSATCPAATPATIAPAAGLLITVTDSAGHQLNFTYDSSSRVSTMTDPAGGNYTYAYSDTGPFANLTSITYPDGKVRTYLYGEAANVSATPNTGVSYAHALTGIVDENGTRYASWTYDANGLATSSEHGAFGSGIDHVGLVYGTPDANGNSTTSVTDVMGVNRSYSFSTLLGVVKNTGISGQPCNGCNAALSYDANGNAASRTDFNGNLTTYTYDLTRNLETSRTEGLTTAGAKTTATRTLATTWNATYRLPASLTEQNTSGAAAVTLRTTSFSYDASGNLLGKTITDAQTPSLSRSWNYTYDTQGHRLSADGPRSDVSDVTHYTYDTQGNLITVTNALTQVNTLGGYDANGRPGTITDPNGLVTSLVYDPRGRLTSRSAGAETTSYTYDGAGNLTHVTLPSGAAYSYTYDAAHRLIQIADSLGNKLVYTLDNADNRIKEQLYDSTGTLVQTRNRVFDALSRLYQDIGAVNQTTTYAYDANGNLTSVSDPLTRVTTNAYDALNRLITNTDTANGQTHYGYNTLDQLTQVTDPRSLVTNYSRDGLNNLNQTLSPDTGSTVNTYDAAGNVLTRTDAKGQVASYAYDALNRLTGISYAGAPAQTVSYQYDQGTNGIGHLTQITDATGTAGYIYNVHGRLVGEVDQNYGALYTTTYAYDGQGRLTAITYPSGRTVNYTLDTLGRINQIATTFNGQTTVLASNIAYQPFGGVQSFNYGDGVTAPVQSYTRQFDQDGRIASYTLNGQAMSIGYDAASQIAFISDPLNLANIANYSYDPMSRLTGYTQSATSQSFGYDADGNRISQTLGSTSSTYTYPPTSNALASIQTGAGSPQSFTQDANGATTSDPARQYAYDVKGRLIQTTTAQGIINYEVNALGLRVRKQVPYAGTDTEYHYDIQGHLIGESAAGVTQFNREYVYLGDQPVAVLQ
jgi:YD repeat-containing protein